MKQTRKTTRIGLLALMAVGAAISTAAAEDQPRKPGQVFEQVCAHCHMGDKAVGPPITMKFPESVHKARGDYMRQVVRHGRNAMPAFRHSEISDAELNALLEALMTGEFAPGKAEK